MGVATQWKWRERSAWLHGAVGVIVVASFAAPPTRAQSCTTTIVSLDHNGVQSTSHASTSYRRSISTDGRFVAFSTNSKLVPEDTDPWRDAYLRDRVLGTTEVLSISTSGVKGNAPSSGAELTPDARYAVITTSAFNIFDGDLNGVDDVILRDRQAGETTLISLSTNGEQGNDGSTGGSISADGRYVAFWSYATNFVTGDTNGVTDVFVRDRVAGTTTCISFGLSGSTANSYSNDPVLSADGRFVAFHSGASDLIANDANPFFDAFVFDRLTSELECVSIDLNGAPAGGGVVDMSADGRFVSFETGSPGLVVGDTNGRNDVFVRDRVLDATERVSVSSSGAQANFNSGDARISANGRFVAFESSASNLVSGDTGDWDIFVHDRQLGTTTLVSQSSSGQNANAQCVSPCISPDGTCVIFDSMATNLVVPDTNFSAVDVVLRECPPAGPFSYCAPKTSSLGCVPAIGSSGALSTSAASPFDVSAAGINNRRFGALFYGTSGQAMLPFQGGLLCVAPPLTRTSVQNAGGSPPPVFDCSGEFHFDFNAWIQGGSDPALVAGQQVWTQYWFRDSGYPPPDSIGLTDALEFTIL